MSDVSDIFCRLCADISKKKNSKWRPRNWTNLFLKMYIFVESSIEDPMEQESKVSLDGQQLLNRFTYSQTFLRMLNTHFWPFILCNILFHRKLYLKLFGGARKMWGVIFCLNNWFCQLLLNLNMLFRMLFQTLLRYFFESLIL